MSNKKISSELQGITRLATAATIGITNLVEKMHKRIVHPPLLPSNPIQHLITKIADVTYGSIHWSTQFFGNNLDTVLGYLGPALGEIKTTDKREALHAALNGVIGDYLEETENPLKVIMQFRYQSTAIKLNQKSIKAVYPNVNGKIILMVHGSCMNDIQWTTKEHNHGIALAQELNKTPVYLNYNSGRHISSNGQDFSELLEELVLNWPVPVEELVILGHSMGGLVTRSAVYYGQQLQKSWVKYVQKLIFLGTPHHGAPLERAGNILDVLLATIPYARPFAKLAKIRSAGVTDLRYGNLIDEDWNRNDRFEMQGDQRQNVPLPKEIDCFSIAAVIGKATDSKVTQMLGDRLVTVKSALGQHQNTTKKLDFKKENTWVAYEHTHLDLLNTSEVYAKIKAWLI